MGNQLRCNIFLLHEQINIFKHRLILTAKGQNIKLMTNRLTVSGMKHIHGALICTVADL